MKVRDIMLARPQTEEVSSVGIPCRHATPAIRPCSDAVMAPIAGNRDFLSRPVGQEDNPDAWAAWAPFLTWLQEYHPGRFQAVCEAEEAIRSLEQQGITAGQEYEQACVELFRRFEEGRQLRFKGVFRMWVQ